jgi:hypothetical protein
MSLPAWALEGSAALRWFGTFLAWGLRVRFRFS